MDETYVNNLAAALRKIGTIHTVGEEWHAYSGEIPAGGVPYSGQTVSRETYAALWQYAQDKGLVKTEAEWQALAASGDVKFYGEGDGSTTFRMPKVGGSALNGVFAFGVLTNVDGLDVSQIDATVRALESSVNTISTNVGTLQTNVGNISTSVGALNTNVGNLTTSVNGLNTSVTTLQTNVGTLQTNVTNLQTNVTNLQTSVAGKLSYSVGTTDLTAGSSALATGSVYLMYE